MISIIFCIILAFVLFNVLLNSTFFKTYYSKMKEQSLVDNLQIVANYDFYADDFEEKLLSLEESRNLRILIADENFNTVFCSSNERDTMRDFFKDWTSQKQVEESWGSYTIGSSSRPSHSGSRNSYLTIYAKVTKTYFFSTRAFLVAINTPVVAIEDGARVANDFTIIVGTLLLIMGAIATYVVGSSFASPIVRASYAADQVAHLNFSERLPSPPTTRSDGCPAASTTSPTSCAPRSSSFPTPTGSCVRSCSTARRWTICAGISYRTYHTSSRPHWPLFSVTAKDCR